MRSIRANSFISTIIGFLRKSPNNPRLPVLAGVGVEFSADPQKCPDKVPAFSKAIHDNWVKGILSTEAEKKTDDKKSSKSNRLSRKVLESSEFSRSAESFDSFDRSIATSPPKSSGENKTKSSKVPVHRRRRLSDMSWTKEPMDDKLIWVDCEMTGLDYNKEVIMEIGCIITGPDLEEIARQPSIIINVPDERLNAMDTWCMKHHGDSGLTEACRKSSLSSEEVDAQLLAFIEKYTTKQECPMAGNTIFMDRIFIKKQFPKFHDHFHYRNVDVSTIKELTRRWYPSEYMEAPKKKYSHRVLDDILDSIAELKYYKASVFKNEVGSKAREVAAE